NDDRGVPGCRPVRILRRVRAFELSCRAAAFELDLHDEVLESLVLVEFQEVGQLGFALWAQRPFLEGLADLRTLAGGLLLIRADDGLRELHLPPRSAAAAGCLSLSHDVEAKDGLHVDVMGRPGHWRLRCERPSTFYVKYDQDDDLRAAAQRGSLS